MCYNISLVIVVYRLSSTSTSYMFTMAIAAWINYYAYEFIYIQNVSISGRIQQVSIRTFQIFTIERRNRKIKQTKTIKSFQMLQSKQTQSAKILGIKFSNGKCMRCQNHRKLPSFITIGNWQYTRFSSISLRFVSFRFAAARPFGHRNVEGEFCHKLIESVMWHRLLRVMTMFVGNHIWCASIHTHTHTYSVPRNIHECGESVRISPVFFLWRLQCCGCC